MKRPIEADYTSHVAYARALEEYCDWLENPEQEPTVLIQSHRENFWCEDLTCKKCYGADFRFKHAPSKRPWVGLTDEEIKAFDTWHDNREEEIGWVNPSEIVAYIEAKLRSKNT